MQCKPYPTPELELGTHWALLEIRTPDGETNGQTHSVTQCKIVAARWQ